MWVMLCTPPWVRPFNSVSLVCLSQLENLVLSKHQQTATNLSTSSATIGEATWKSLSTRAFRAKGLLAQPHAYGWH